MTTPTPPKYLPDDVAEAWLQIVNDYGDGWERITGPDLEAYAGQVARLRKAQRLLGQAGVLLKDKQGNPIQHPALDIERKAQDEIRKWGNTFKPPRRRRL